jgi:parallel beta-helix repeat protein
MPITGTKTRRRDGALLAHDWLHLPVSQARLPVDRKAGAWADATGRALPTSAFGVSNLSQSDINFFLGASASASNKAWRRVSTATSILLLGVVVGCGGESADTTAVTAVDAPRSSAAALEPASTEKAALDSMADPADATSADLGVAASTEAFTAAAAMSAGVDAFTAGADSDGKASTMAATSTGKVYLVGAGGTLPAGATRVATLMAVPWKTLPAGSRVLVSPGYYSGVTTINGAMGTAANPITVTAYSSSQLPVLSDSVDIQNSSYLNVSYMNVVDSNYGGFIIRNASHHVTVSDSSITGGPVGINVASTAGLNLKILRNTIAASNNTGINIDAVSNSADRSLIQHNSISRSASHGMEIQGSHWQVEYNVVTSSGQTIGGSSGIHLYAADTSGSSCADTVVRFNYSYANIDRTQSDGNGIEVDQWCNANVVSYNAVWNNDGAGIIVYTGSSNAIQNNTAYNDGLDSGHTHGGFGEIILNASTMAGARSNIIWNNVLFSTRANVPAMYVDTRAVPGANVVGMNLYYNSAAPANLLRWTDSSMMSTIRAISATTGYAGSVNTRPAFADAGNPLANGLALSKQPALTAWTPVGQVDMAGAKQQAGWAFFGAYYTAP